MSEQIPDEEPTIGRLVTDATRDISTLINKEIALVKSELRISAKAGGAGAAMFAIAAALALISIIMLSIALAYLIHWNGRGLDLHWAFLCVTGGYLVLAALFGFIGYRKVKKVRAPERSLYQAQQTSKLLKR